MKRIFLKRTLTTFLIAMILLSSALSGTTLSIADTETDTTTSATTETATSNGISMVQPPAGQPPSDGSSMGQPPSGQPPSTDGTAPSEPPTGEPPTGDVTTDDTASSEDTATTATDAAEMPGEPPSSDGSMPGEPPSGGMGGANTMTYDYNGTLSGALTADGVEMTSENESYAAETADQNVALVQNGGTLIISNDVFSKSGDDSDGDNCNFYGINAIMLAVNEGSSAFIDNSTLVADSAGSNGIFATDSATVYADHIAISTTADNSRGLDATYGGEIIANDVDISTQGDHSASIATDRGGGYISVTNSSLSTAGSGSPLLYSTGDIEVDNVRGTATGSQIAGMEGYNTILIYNSDLASTNTATTGSDPIANGVIIYQSTSGDAESSTGETASFEVSASTLESDIQSGAMFYITNTAVNMVVDSSEILFDSDAANLMTVQGNDSNNWGTPGSNGGDVTFTALNQSLTGDVDVDTISTLDFYLLEGSVYTGAMTISENAVNTDASENPITVSIDGSSTWILTADTTISNLNAADGASIVDADGNTVTIIADGETVLAGTSDLTLTVKGSYLAAVETDATNALDTDYIDRDAFDAYYDEATSFSSNAQETQSPDTSDEAAENVETTVDTTEISSNSPVLVILIGIGVIAAGVLVWAATRKKA
jgi:hypothetical protein